LLHFGDHDNFVSEQAIKTIRSAFAEQKQALLYIYPEAGHGFATEKGKRRAEKSAELADQRSLDMRLSLKKPEALKFWSRNRLILAR